VKLLLVVVGSAGDVHPFLGLGRALRGRGHHVTVLTHEEFAGAVGDGGMEFVSLPRPGKTGTARPERRLGAGPLLQWALKPVLRSWFRLARATTVLPLLRPVYEAIRRHHRPDETVVVACSAALGARVAHDRLGVPLVTVHLAPLVFRSVRRPAVQPPFVLPDWSPLWLRRSAFRLLDALILDPLLAGPIDAFRRELGLPPLRQPLHEWRHSPQRVVGLFPPWFAAPQPDWPAQTRLTGFPLYDEAERVRESSDLRRFLDDGEPPVVFTMGSVLKDNRRFFEEAVRACVRLGRRGMLLSPFREQVPASLPPGVRHFEYVPFSRLLPRAAALVYHGGIGTAAQALRAGVPQVVVPQKNDQWDNARHLEALGVARQSRSGWFRGPDLARTLEELLHSPAVGAACRAVATRFPDGAALEETCRLIEEQQGRSAAACASSLAGAF
jgi:UDP:flavonoid glycosyltransferase YjiC (YdhE family)